MVSVIPMRKWVHRFTTIGLPIRDRRTRDFTLECLHKFPVAYPRTGFFTPLSSYRIFMPVQTHPQELHVKILVVGNSSVGKSSLLTRWSENQWLPEDEASATIGVEVLRRKLDVKGENVNLAIWDTAGEENFRTMQSAHYRGAQGIILVYDSTNRRSFEELTRWFKELRTYVSGPVDTVILGNKIDKDYRRQVPTAEAAAFAKEMRCQFAETSAKTAVGVRKAFRDMVERIVENPELRVFFKPSPPQASFTRPRTPRFLGY